ncbi:MAG: bifunctional serine/threonine-protein kinase/formylglycine-generating enzyme family protein [Chlamydiota bacterium]
MINRENIGDYTVIKQIGQGSLGAVFLAEHRYLKRPYALKILPEELGSDRGFVQRFEKEVAEIAALEHPHIVKVHNVSYADGRFFLVTDCIVDVMGETTNLAEYLNLNNEQLEEDELLQIVRQVASAIDYAHAESMAHRGIKLNNVLIGKGKETQVYLSDFGLSRMIGMGTVLTKTYKILAEALGIQEKGDLSKLSKLHLSFWQNYAFLAPEQKIMGDPRQVDVKADIWAFGVLVYYMITREFPEGIFELPSQCAREYKLNWDLLITSCLQYDPKKRPSSLNAVMQELYHAPVSSGKVEMASAPRPILKPQEIVRPQYEADPGAIFQLETTVARYQPTKSEEREITPLQTDMIIIPEGNYFRGSNNGGRDEMPRHAIQLNSFALDIHPVTNEQFALFIEALGGEKDHNNNDIIRLRESRIRRSGGKLNIESGYAKHPVVGITWYGAVAYAKWVGKRLPTEAEWEVAACGGNEDFLYPTGQNIERTQANFFSSDTTAVMSYPPNGYGLYDMAGNVYDWCQDWYDYHYYNNSVQEPNNPKGPLQGVYRVLRGGCWKSLKEDLRSSHRHRNNPGTMNGTYGFRCAAGVS